MTKSVFPNTIDTILTLQVSSIAIINYRRVCMHVKYAI